MTESYDAADLMRELIRPDLKRDVERIAIADNEVKVAFVGEALDDIWWRGKQWAVTEYGIECLDGTYYIEKERLLDGRIFWPQHMAGKIWVDVDEFTTAWLVGLVLHGHGKRIDAEATREMFGRLPPRRHAVAE